MAWIQLYCLIALLKDEDFDVDRNQAAGNFCRFGKFNDGIKKLTALMIST